MLPTLVTFSNYGYRDFALNLMINLSENLKNHSIDFYCLDQKIYNFLKEKDFGNLKYNLILFEKDVSNDFENYNTKEYVKIMHDKIDVIKDALAKYEFIHFLDCDVVCINEPPEDFYKSYQIYDVIFQFDMYLKDNLFHTWACMGNACFRNTEGTRKLLENIDTYKNSEDHSHKNDQECLKQYFDDNNIEDIREDPDSKNYVYPLDKYVNGYLVDRDLINWKDSYFFHANHCIGSEEKIRLLRKVNKWYL